MQEKAWSKYMDLCIGYRVFTWLFSTAAYLWINMADGRTGVYYLTVVAGMFASCALSSWLYKKIGKRRQLLRILYTLEVLTYSVFVYVGGGFSNPYLWYQTSCLLLMVTLEDNMVLTMLVSLWCFLWAVVKSIGSGGPSYQEVNIGLGILIVIGGFYIFRFHIRWVERQEERLFGLNKKLEIEKERSKNAFLQMTDLYETFNLFAMTNPEKIVKELSALLRRAIAPSGCIVLKIDSLGMFERVGICGIDEKIAEELIGQVGSIKVNHLGETNQRHLIDTGGEIYEAILIGEDLFRRGILIRKRLDGGKEKEEYYWKLMDIIFRSLDIHSQMEKFITMEEQNRIANEIHDTVIQKLFGMACTLKLLETKMKEIGEEEMDKEEMTDHIHTLKTSAESTMRELRESIYGRSFQETIHTFIDTMKYYMQEVSQLSGTSIVMDIHQESDYMTPAQKIAVYRIACEAVNNAIRHGHSRCIDIQLSLDCEQIRMEIKDDGSGFKEQQEDFREGKGLKNMRNIAALLKGSLSIESEAEHGTKIKLSLPR